MSEKTRNNFELSAVNSLPRPQLDNLKIDDFNLKLSKKELERQLCELEQHLCKALPYYVKPNRAIALLNTPSSLLSHIQNPKSRWLIRLHPDHLAHKSLSCIAVITRHGFLSILVCYGDAVYPLKLKSRSPSAHSPSPYWINLCEPSPYSKISDTHSFALSRFTQQSDDEGHVYLRLFTSKLEHLLDFNFATEFKQDFNPENPPSLSYSHITFDKDEQESIAFHQIGGWDSSPAFFRSDSITLPYKIYQSTGYDKKQIPLELPGLTEEIKLWAICEQDGLQVVGGNSDGLWLRQKEGGAYVNIREGNPLRGFVRSLIFTPNEFHDEPLLLLGGDDYFLHVIDTKGQRLASADMKGAIEAIVLLSHEKKEHLYKPKSRATHSI